MGSNRRKNGRGFTLIELLVVISIIALLLAILIPSLTKAKDHAKKVGCSTNLRSLSLAARMYADENDGFMPSSTAYWDSRTRPGWCGMTSNYNTGELYDRETQIYGSKDDPTSGLINGQLWKYIENIDGWRCPADPEKEQLRSYCMGGEWWGAHYSNGTFRQDPGPRLYKKITGLKNASSRFLFVDQLGANIDAYAAIWYSQDMWWNIPNYLHSGGSVNGYADGHVEAYKFTKATVKLASESYGHENSGFRMDQVHVNDDLNLKKDLIYYQRATWGELGWTIE